MKRLLLKANVQAQNQKADAAITSAIAGDDINAASKFNDAHDALVDLMEIVSKTKDQDQEMTDAMTQAERENNGIQLICNALQNKRIGNKPNALTALNRMKAQQIVFGVKGMDAYILKQLTELGAGGDSFTVLRDNGRKALGAVDESGRHTELEQAKSFFKSAKDQGADRNEMNELITYVDDLLLCENEKNNMRLYKKKDPLKALGSQTPWDNTDRKNAFCIDRFEFPNKQNVPAPQTNVSWAEAAAACGLKQKVLCKATDWENACRGGVDSTQQYPYGNAGKDDACNTGSSAAAPSGSKPACRNASGVYDMSGKF